MTTEQMAEAERKRFDRSAGQHIRAMRKRADMQ